MWAPNEELSIFNMMSFGNNGMYGYKRSLTEFQGHQTYYMNGDTPT